MAISNSKRKMVLTKTNGRCAYCGRTLGTTWDVDHIVSQNRGGSDDLDNLVAACRSCNVTKRDRSVEEFRSFFRAPILAAREQTMCRLHRLASQEMVNEHDVRKAMEMLDNTVRTLSTVAVHFYGDNLNIFQESQHDE